jgi:uncharacterized 2Fe-2S/4Fe-4S cluster protein (DUF4445 family)
LLLSRDKRRAAEETVRNIEHIELESTPDFFEIFVDGCQFKPMPKQTDVAQAKASPTETNR